MTTRCEVRDCGATAVATVTHTRRCASPGEEHRACEECARYSRGRGLEVAPDRSVDSLSEQATPAHLKSGGRR